MYASYIIKQWLGVSNPAAIAAAYESVIAITFITLELYPELQGHPFDGYMVAVMAIIELQAFIVAFALMQWHETGNEQRISFSHLLRHSLTNASVLLLLVLIIGFVADDRQSEGVKPFTTDIFKGFLAIFLLEMGMVTARNFKAFREYGWFALLFGILVPAINGCTVAWISQFVVSAPGNRFIFSILAASAYYIAVPAAMRIAAPKADPGLYIPMALGVTYPFTITLGMPLNFMIIS